MHLGLIGGIGPAATSHYYRLLVEAVSDLRVTIDHAQLKVLSENVASQSIEAQAKVFAVHIDSLKGAGATIAAVTSVAGHFCISELSRRASLPVISVLDSLEKHFQANRIRRIGVLGNRIAMQSQLFGMIERVDFVTLPKNKLFQVGDAYGEIARSGRCTDEQRSTFVSAGADLVADGADAILLGGTDLFLAFDGHEQRYPVIDAARVHVADIIDRASK
jgi:aspartate racemase